jgi:hypothetical protein
MFVLHYFLYQAIGKLVCKVGAIEYYFGLMHYSMISRRKYNDVVCIVIQGICKWDDIPLESEIPHAESNGLFSSGR